MNLTGAGLPHIGLKICVKNIPRDTFHCGDCCSGQIISHFHIIRHFRSLVNLHTYREIILVKLLRSKANSFIRYGISKEKKGFKSLRTIRKQLI
jgi:hypothetical protein